MLDGFLGPEGAAQVRAAVVSALESAATAGGLSGGAPCRVASPLHPTAYLFGTAHVAGPLIGLFFSRAQAGWRGASEVTARCGQRLRPAGAAPAAAAHRSISCCCGVSTGWSRARCTRAWQRRAICAGAATRVSLYPAEGGRYVRHVDNTCSGGRGRLCNGRRLSAVYYLNPSWSKADGSTAVR